MSTYLQNIYYYQSKNFFDCRLENENPEVDRIRVFLKISSKTVTSQAKGPIMKILLLKKTLAKMNYYKLLYKQNK